MTARTKTESVCDLKRFVMDGSQLRASVSEARPLGRACSKEYALADARASATYGGEGGIRTHGTVPRSQHFQCCQFNHSCTSPKLPIDQFGYEHVSYQ